MTATKTNEVRRGEAPGVKAKLSFVWISPYKVRQVLDLVRGKSVAEAESILRRCERDAADPIGKVLGSAVANAHVTAGLDAEELYVSACYADEGMTFKRFRYRARGRAGKIRKRTSHITVVVNRLPEDRLAQLRTRQAADLASRRRRVAGSRRRGGDATSDVAAAAIAAVEASPTEPAPVEEDLVEPAEVIADAEQAAAEFAETAESTESTPAASAEGEPEPAEEASAPSAEQENK
jgi:large subunit ribosomal protein L22